MSKEIISPIAAPTTVGNYTAAQNISAINSALRISFAKTVTSSTRCAMFACDDLTIASGSITGTFSATDPTTWPNGGKGVRLLGDAEIRGGAYSVSGAPRTFVDVADPVSFGPGLIVLRTLGTAAADVEVNGLGDTVFPSASITPVALTLLERDASGNGFLVALTLGAVGATVSPSGDIRITRAAQDVISSVLVDGTTANPLISTDGSDGLVLAGAGTMHIGDDSTDRTINIGNGTGASKVNIISGTSAQSAWSVAAGGTLSLASAAVACTINLGTNTGAKTINIGTDNAIKTINIGTGTQVNPIAIGGAASTLGFFGVTPTARPAAYTINYAAAASTTLADYTNTPSGIDNLQAGNVYAQASELLLASAQIKSLSAFVKQLQAQTKLYGLTA